MLSSCIHYIVRIDGKLESPGHRPPKTWSFATNEHGKPFLSPDVGDPPFRFNLTHAAGLAACVVSYGLEVGVDVENLERKTEPGLPEPIVCT